MASDLILPLSATEATLDSVGGKGANLAKLVRAGFPVPDGFMIPTQVYRQYVFANKLDTQIQDRVRAIRPDDPKTLETVSQDIRGWFTSGLLSPQDAGAIRGAYTGLGKVPVAVRSSATAEDLPEMSFAGQQDTFLNVIGEEALLEAVVNCWSSLWTARAIGYRARNQISQDEVALAVIIQEMVQSEVSGVMFTVNPITGLRTETVIDATLGLGEALVGGHVEPDHYVIDTIENQIVEISLGSKAVAIHGVEGGGVQIVEEPNPRQALPDAQIMELAQLGQRIADLYDFPQDIEWAWADGKLTVLQSRPITALYPLPEGMEAEPFKVMLSFAAVQGIMDPFTPLGRDVLGVIIAGGGKLVRMNLAYDNQSAIFTAGERLWINFTSVAQNSIGRKMAPHIVNMIEPTIGQAVESIWDDPRLVSNKGGLRLSTLPKLATFALPFWKNTILSWLNPDGRREKVLDQIEDLLATDQAKSTAIGKRDDKFSGRVSQIHDLHDSFPYAVPNVFPIAISGLIPLAILNRLASHLPHSATETEQGRSNLALELNRGIPHNVTTEMDLSLWEVATTIKVDPDSNRRFLQVSAPELAEGFLAGNLPTIAQSAISDFMEQYGMRGPGEIDFGHPRWRDEPTPIMQVLGSYLRIEDENLAPSKVHERGVEAAKSAAVQLEERVRQTRGGWLKARVVRWGIRRLRASAGLREAPKFYVIQRMGIIRQALLESGKELVEAGLIEKPDDLFYLYLKELESFAKAYESSLENPQGGQEDFSQWKELVAERRAAYDQELRRRQIPRVLLSDGLAFYEGLSASDEDGEGVMVGSPVSPGVVEGKVRVVLDPVGAQLEPGEIMVCPGTDPAWTPLFLAAGGLIMEVGGMMTHGAIVAREYGIPAVVGVHQATTRLQTGQTIRLDGSSGQVFVDP